MVTESHLRARQLLPASIGRCDDNATRHVYGGAVGHLNLAGIKRREEQSLNRHMCLLEFIQNDDSIGVRCQSVKWSFSGTLRSNVARRGADDPVDRVRIVELCHVEQNGFLTGDHLGDDLGGLGLTHTGCASEKPRCWSRLGEDVQLAATQCVNETREYIFLALEPGEFTLQSLDIKLRWLGLTGHEQHGDRVESLGGQRDLGDLLKHLSVRGVARGECFLDRSVMADHAVAQCSIKQCDGRIGTMPGTHQSIGGSNDVIEDIRCHTDLVLVVGEHTGQNDIENRTGLFSVKLIDDDRREATLECRIIVKTFCLTHRRCCDDTQVSSGQRRLEDLCNLAVGGIAVIGNDVDLINEEQCVIIWILGELDNVGDAVL